MTQKIKFGSLVLSDNSIYQEGERPICNKDVVKICHSDVAEYLGGVPIVHTFNIQIHLSNGQIVVAKEDIDIRTWRKNNQMNKLEDTKLRYMAFLNLLSVTTGLKSQNLLSGIDNFFAGAWFKHNKRLVDFIWLLIFGIPLVLVLIITRQPDNLSDTMLGVTILCLFPFVFFGCGYMSLRKLAQFLSDR